MKRSFLLCLVILFFGSCASEPDISDDLLDGKILMDLSQLHPEHYLVSYATPNPTPSQAEKPVLLVVHGFSASTFEWDEFRTWAGSRTDFSISQVLLGGHGRDFESFKAATWHDWQRPVMEEYQRLAQAGYTNISLAGTSTGCAVLLEMLASGYFLNRLQPRHLFLIDPIVIPSSKTLSLVGIIGPLIGYMEVENNEDEKKFWYTYRPYQTLKELRSLTNRVRLQLQKGVILPGNMTMKVFKSDHDDVADPVSAVLIYKGIKDSSGQPIAITMVPSQLHVYTRLSLRNGITAEDIQNQENTFQEIVQTILP
jgi:carboxylesterase